MEHLSLAYAIPFAGLLLSIAAVPLFAPHFWERHMGKAVAAWSLAFVLPAMFFRGGAPVLHEVLHTALIDYVPFIILVFSLYVAAGGIVVDGRLAGTPARTTALLGVGAFLASLLGTTGASMVLVRPLLKGIASRRRKVHSVIFFIFLVSNIGGCLTPVGDPPLFMGYLHGVPFFWTLHALPPMLFTTGVLLALHYVIDLRAWKKEGGRAREHSEVSPGFRVRGRGNAAILLSMVVIVFLSGVVGDSWGDLNVLGVEMQVSSLVRELLLIGLAVLSLKTTSVRLHQANSFTWGPVSEVARLFIGIFICLIPLMEILREGAGGALGWLLAAVDTPMRYFWASGALSSFLDNTPTYLLFFNVAGGESGLPQMLSQVTTLLAVSCGAVFMGANSYIGNAPNFLVRNIAEEHGLRMPSFGGYLLWSGAILLPLFVVTGWIFF